MEIFQKTSTPITKLMTRPLRPHKIDKTHNKIYILNSQVNGTLPQDQPESRNHLHPHSISDDTPNQKIDLSLK